MDVTGRRGSPPARRLSRIRSFSAQADRIPTSATSPSRWSPLRSKSHGCRLLTLLARAQALAQSSILWEPVAEPVTTGEEGRLPARWQRRRTADRPAGMSRTPHLQQLSGISSRHGDGGREGSTADPTGRDASADSRPVMTSPRRHGNGGSPPGDLGWPT